MILLNKYSKLPFCILLSFGCQQKIKSTSATTFKYHNIQLTTDIKIEADSLSKLDSLQKRAMIPNITSELSMDLNYMLSSFFSAYLVSQQNKIGNIQPIIIETHCDDIGRLLILITLNERNKPEDFLIIDREEFCGGDSISFCEKYKHSILKENEIITYDLFEITSSEPNEKILYKDSIVFKSLIDKEGKITTKKIDSVRIYQNN